MVTEDEARDLNPRVVFVNERNRIMSRGSDLANAPEGFGLRPGNQVSP
jgi:aspartate 1-decarboxylase